LQFLPGEMSTLQQLSEVELYFNVRCHSHVVENFITVMTPAVYDYQYLPEVAVSKKSHVTFRVRAGADAHVALSTMYGDTDRKTYELVLGGWNNSRSAVRYAHVVNDRKQF